MLAFVHHALTGHELGLWTAMGRLWAELLAMLRQQVSALELLTCAFGALGGTHWFGWSGGVVFGRVTLGFRRS